MAILYRARVKSQPQEEDWGLSAGLLPAHRGRGSAGGRRSVKKGRQLTAIMHLLCRRPVHECYLL